MTQFAFRAVLLAAALATTSALAAPADQITFQLVPSPTALPCITDGSGNPPTANVTVVRGSLHDTLTINLHHIKPNLAFDLFTVQRSSLLANGSPDPAFTNFGMAWYQTDLQVGAKGGASATIQTILLDQIFGFDPDATLAPTNTFHVGFWFNNPNDAAPCGFNVANPTPFNGEHKAGPVAMISLPKPKTGLGPLCTNPNTSTTPATCNP